MPSSNLIGSVLSGGRFSTLVSSVHWKIPGRTRLFIQSLYWTLWKRKRLHFTTHKPSLSQSSLKRRSSQQGHGRYNTLFSTVLLTFSHPTIKFTAEISDKETTFPDTYIYKGARFERDAILTWWLHLMCVLILNQLRHFNIIRILVPVTNKELKKASLKGRPSDFSELTLPK